MYLQNYIALEWVFVVLRDSLSAPARAPLLQTWGAVRVAARKRRRVHKQTVAKRANLKNGLQMGIFKKKITKICRWNVVLKCVKNLYHSCNRTSEIIMCPKLILGNSAPLSQSASPILNRPFMCHWNSVNHSCERVFRFLGDTFLAISKIWQKIYQNIFKILYKTYVLIYQ